MPMERAPARGATPVCLTLSLKRPDDPAGGAKPRRDHRFLLGLTVKTFPNGYPVEDPGGVLSA